jgi:hypothetical protein
MSETLFLISIKDSPRVCQGGVSLLPILQEDDSPETEKEHEVRVPGIVNLSAEELVSE